MSNYQYFAVLTILWIIFLPFEAQSLSHSLVQDGIEDSTAQIALESCIFWTPAYTKLNLFFSC